VGIAEINYETARSWIAEGRRMALCTLVETVGSAPLGPGAMMMVDSEGAIEGSVTGGCVEGALAQEATEVLSGGHSRVKTYGISDDQAADVGLMCGGTVHVFVEVPEPEDLKLLDQVFEAVLDGRPAAISTVLDGPEAGRRIAIVGGESRGGLDGPELLGQTVEREMRGMLSQGLSGLRHYAADGATMGADLRVHVQSFAEPPAMVIFGAIDFAAATAALARDVGYRVTIVDARKPFLQSARFSDVAEVVVDWPDRYLESRKLGPRDVVLVFTHDPKFDEPALISALASGAGYVGALGSRRTQRDREERLREAGIEQSEIDRIAAPCGLDIGARTPSETAVSVLAEVIALQNARSGEPLKESEGPIHPRRQPAPS